MDSSIWVWLAGAIGYVVGSLISPLIAHMLSRAWDDRRDRIIKQTQARKELKAQINFYFCDVWEDRNVIIPHTKSFRKDLVDGVMQIRESLRLLLTGLPNKKINELRQISVDFLQIAKEEPNANDAAWCKTYEEEINEICEKLKEFLAD
jgi:hypothetical protein